MLFLESSTKHISGVSFPPVLLSPPIAGNGGRANTIQLLAFGAAVVMVARVRPCQRTPFNVAQPLLVENPYRESAVAISRAARSVK